MKKHHLYRGTYYLLGMLILAMGLTLNTKTGLGVSAIISVPYTISVIWKLDFGNITLIVYTVFVAIQFLLKGKKAKLYDLLQVPLAVIFTRFLNLFSERLSFSFQSLWQNLLLLGIAVLLTGVGAAMSLDMRLVPNPGDGIVQVISDRIHREVGLTKNGFDLLNICITLIISCVFYGKLAGVGIGTIISMILTGRVISIFNRWFKDKMERQAEVYHSSIQRK